MKLGTVLRKYRISREISLRQLAKETGVSFPTLSRIENGKGFDADTLVTLLAWLTSPEVAR